jgi:anti-anti-sigma regulatory factor
MAELRTFRLGDGRWAITVRGDLDSAAALTIAAEVKACADGSVVVDLRHARLVDAVAFGALADAARATFVADRPLRDAFAGRIATVAPSLRAAFAL